MTSPDSPDFRALAQELLQHARVAQKVLIGEGIWDDDDQDEGLFDRADAALATPPPEPPEPPTDEEIEEWADAAPYVPSRYYPDPEIDGYHRCFDEEEFGRTIRAALERWGN